MSFWVLCCGVLETVLSFFLFKLCEMTGVAGGHGGHGPGCRCVHVTCVPSYSRCCFKEIVLLVACAFFNRYPCLNMRMMIRWLCSNWPTWELKSQKKKRKEKKHTSSRGLSSSFFCCNFFYFFFLNRKVGYGRGENGSATCLSLAALLQRSLPEVNPGECLWSLPATDSWTWWISPPETSWQASATVIAPGARSHYQPRMFVCFFSLPCNSQHMPRPYYQQGLGLPGHMVTDWVDWLQVSISLMPVGLGLQMSLSLPMPRKKKKNSARPLSAFFLTFFFFSPAIFVSKISPPFYP